MNERDDGPEYGEPQEAWFRVSDGEAISPFVGLSFHGKRIEIEDGRSALDFPLPIEMPCGAGVVYYGPEQIPTEDTPCECGDPSHWLVRYTFTDEDA